MNNNIMNNSTINQIYNNLFTHYNKVSGRITDAKYIIEHLSRENYLKKWFLSDYFFWEMYLSTVRDFVSKADEYYDKRQFDIIVFEISKLLDKETPYYEQVKNIVEVSYNDYFYAIDSVITRIDIPEKYNTKQNKKKGRYEYLTLKDIIDAMNKWNDDESHYVLDKINIFMADYIKLGPM